MAKKSNLGTVVTILNMGIWVYSLVVCFLSV